MSNGDSITLPASATVDENHERIGSFAMGIITEARPERRKRHPNQKSASELGVCLKQNTHGRLMEEQGKTEEFKNGKGKLTPAIQAFTILWFWAKLKISGKETARWKWQGCED